MIRNERDEPIHPIGGGGAVSIGLTKREYFAAMAMQGYLSSGHISGMVTNRVIVPDILAVEAVAYADALLIELEKSR
jgi:hypothetical protein